MDKERYVLPRSPIRAKRVSAARRTPPPPTTRACAPAPSITRATARASSSRAPSSGVTQGPPSFARSATCARASAAAARSAGRGISATRRVTCWLSAREAAPETPQRARAVSWRRGSVRGSGGARAKASAAERRRDCGGGTIYTYAMHVFYSAVQVQHSAVK